MNSHGMGSSSPGPSPSLLTKCAALWVEQAGAPVQPRRIVSFSFFIIFLHTFQEAISALRMLNVLDGCINSLGRNLALSLFVHNVYCLLGNTVDFCIVAMGTFVGHSFLISVLVLVPAIPPFL